MFGDSVGAVGVVMLISVHGGRVVVVVVVVVLAKRVVRLVGARIDLFSYKKTNIFY